MYRNTLKGALELLAFSLFNLSYAQSSVNSSTPSNDEFVDLKTDQLNNSGQLIFVINNDVIVSVSKGTVISGIEISAKEEIALTSAETTTEVKSEKHQRRTLKSEKLLSEKVVGRESEKESLKSADKKHRKVFVKSEKSSENISVWSNVRKALIPPSNPDLKVVRTEEPYVALSDDAFQPELVLGNNTIVKLINFYNSHFSHRGPPELS